MDGKGDVVTKIGNPKHKDELVIYHCWQYRQSNSVSGPNCPFNYYDKDNAIQYDPVTYLIVCRCFCSFMCSKKQVALSYYSIGIILYLPFVKSIKSKYTVFIETTRTRNIILILRNWTRNPRMFRRVEMLMHCWVMQRVCIHWPKKRHWRGSRRNEQMARLPSIAPMNNSLPHHQTKLSRHKQTILSINLWPLVNTTSLIALLLS